MMLSPVCRGNIGFIFTNGDLGHVREVIEKYRVPAPARVGAIAPSDVFVPPGPTGADPGQTSFFQVLQIPTKIAKGQIEITNEVHTHNSVIAFILRAFVSVYSSQIRESAATVAQ